VAVLVIISAFGLVNFATALLTPFVGFLTGFLFAAIGLLTTSFVKNMNHFNFFFTGLLSPMFMFCGTIFPISNLPPALQVFAEVLPLTHPVRLGRVAATNSGWELSLLWDLAYTVVVAVLVMALAAKRLERRIVK
jgi:lipooligosaccharide transport system permease protein